MSRKSPRKRTTTKSASPRTTSSFAAIFAGMGLQRTKRPSGLLKDATDESAGEAYDRAPCPHALIIHDTIADLESPDDLSRLRTRRTSWRCERPADHLKSRDEDERLHATATGRTW